SSGRSTSRTAISRRSSVCPTIACWPITRSRCRGRTERPRPRCSLRSRRDSGLSVSLYAKLQQRAAQKNPLRIGLIGAGQFGAMYLAQLPRTPGVQLAGIADLAPASARRNLARVGWKPERFAAATLDDALAKGTTHVGEDWQALVRHPTDDILVA